MNFEKNNEYAIALLIKSKILPIKTLYFKTLCSLIYDIVNKSCPTSISICFIYSKQVNNDTLTIQDFIR